MTDYNGLSNVCQSHHLSMDAHHIPEKICIVLDVPSEENSLIVPSHPNLRSYSFLTMLKHSVESFINAKRSICDKHQFALVIDQFNFFI